MKNRQIMGKADIFFELFSNEISSILRISGDFKVYSDALLSGSQLTCIMSFSFFAGDEHQPLRYQTTWVWIHRFFSAKCRNLEVASIIGLEGMKRARGM